MSCSGLSHSKSNDTGMASQSDGCEAIGRSDSVADVDRDLSDTPDAYGTSVDTQLLDVPLNEPSTDTNFAWDFAARAREALADTPAWTCATALPTVPVSGQTEARNAIQAFVARVVGLPISDIAITEGLCGAPSQTTCAARFAHDCAKSGGDTYNRVVALAEELQGRADSVEETIWVPTNQTGNVVLSGISNGLLVGMVVFNGDYPCH